MKLFNDRDWYYYHNLVNQPDKEVRKEYTRIRKAFNKAINQGFGEFHRSITGQTVNPYPVMKGLSIQQIRHYLSEMVNMSHARGFTAAGRREMKRQSIQTLKARGVKSVNGKNWDTFLRFASHYYDTYGIKYTDQALQAFDAVQRRGGDMDILMKNVSFYENHLADLQKIPVHGHNTGKLLRSFELKAERAINYD